MKSHIKLCYAPRDAYEALGLFELAMIGQTSPFPSSRILSHLEVRKAKVVSIETISQAQADEMVKQYCTCLA